MQRGRRSAAALAVVPASPLETVQRQKAPYELNDEETEIWEAVVGDYAADWFSPSTVPLLTAYCRHTIQARRVAELIEKAIGNPDLAVQDYDRLLKMQERESRAISALASRMRIAQQATRSDSAKNKPPKAAGRLLADFRESRRSGDRVD